MGMVIGVWLVRDIVVTATHLQLWISDNCGRSWNFITHNVQLVEL